ncbi:hypothetical protein LTR94_032275, partial [Friedmanniomyces endolithicus]
RSRRFLCRCHCRAGIASEHHHRPRTDRHPARQRHDDRRHRPADRPRPGRRYRQRDGGGGARLFRRDRSDRPSRFDRYGAGMVPEPLEQGRR